MITAIDISSIPTGMDRGHAQHP